MWNINMKFSKNYKNKFQKYKWVDNYKKMKQINWNSYNKSNLKTFKKKLIFAFNNWLVVIVIANISNFPVISNSVTYKIITTTI